MLKYMYRNRPIKSDHLADLNAVHPNEFVNLNAVLDVYRRGDIKVIDDQVTVWFAGRLVMRPTHRRELKDYDLVNKVPEWRAKYGPGRIWVEEVNLYKCPFCTRNI
jgi:hypothetical protein